MVVGDSTEWADPEDLVRKFVPNYDLMWAIFGVARLPAPGVELRAFSDSNTKAWQYISGGDTLVYARVAGDKHRLVAEVRRGDAVVGRTETTFGPDGVPVTARLTVPGGPARLDITFVSRTNPESFDSTTWTAVKP